MKISKIKLENGGLKGIIVNYLKNEEKDKLTFNNEYQVKYRAPIHSYLGKLIKSLEKYVVDICNLNEDSEVSVLGVTANDKQFLISAKAYVLNGQTIAINTPNIKDGMYSAYDEIQKIIAEIHKEIEVYVSAGQKIDKRQLVLDFYKDKKEELEGLDMADEEAVKRKAIDILNGMGCIVVEREEEPEQKLTMAHSDTKEERLDVVDEDVKGKVG